MYIYICEDMYVKDIYFKKYIFLGDCFISVHRAGLFFITVG